MWWIPERLWQQLDRIEAKLQPKNPEPAVPDVTVAIDCGHGGFDPYTLEYHTAPSKMAKHYFGTVYEGVINRRIGIALADMLRERGIDYYFLMHQFEDTPLEDRTNLANELHKEYPNLVVVSIHCNAFRDPTAKGWEVFTSVGKTRADRFANKVYEAIEKKNMFVMRPDFSDGDHDKEAKFWMLTRTKAPAILTENGFFTNPAEAMSMLFDPYWVQEVAQAHYEGIIEAANT